MLCENGAVKLFALPKMQRIVASMAEAVFAQCIREIDATFPLESGGVLMGTWVSDSEVAIRAAIGPGPAASHERFRFRPDLAWQHEQIARYFADSEGLITYLGDWHSHPQASHGRLSLLDQEALGLIMATPEAQCAEPLMAIFSGYPEAWHLSVWQGLGGWSPPWRKVRLRALRCSITKQPGPMQ